MLVANVKYVPSSVGENIGGPDVRIIAPAPPDPAEAAARAERAAQAEREQQERAENLAQLLARRSKLTEHLVEARAGLETTRSLLARVVAEGGDGEQVAEDFRQRVGEVAGLEAALDLVDCDLSRADRGRRYGQYLVIG